MRRTAFLSVAAAEWNLGDIYIRRAVTRAMADDGMDAVVYTGTMGPGYVEAFEFPSNWVVTASPRRFLTLLLGACIRRKATVIMAPGPAQLETRLSPLIKRIGVALMLMFARLSGNRVAVLGRALRGSGPVALKAERLIARSSVVYLARDPQTAELVGPPAQARPDLGFADSAARSGAAPETGAGRPLIALSLRYDRNPSIDLVREFAEHWRSRGFDIVLVTQVRQDREIHDVLSKECGFRHVDWPDGRSQLEQERLIVQTYAQCIAVVSDRLHALIVGCRQGAIPVIADSPGESKLHATMDFILEPQTVWLHTRSAEQTSFGLDLSDGEVQRIDKLVKEASAALTTSLHQFTARSSELRDATSAGIGQ